MPEQSNHLEVVDPLHDLIRSATPVRGDALSSPDIQRLLGQMATEAAEAAEVVPATPSAAGVATTAGRRWHRRIVGVTAGAALMVLSFTGVGAAAATGIGRWIGWFDTPTSTESIRDEAYLNTSSPAFARAFDLAVAAYPLPPGETYDATRRDLLGSGVLKQVTGLRGELALRSTCPWSAAWLAADARHASAPRKTAVTALMRIATSPDVAAVDGGGIVTAAAQLADAAATGDASAVVRLRAAQGCEDDK